MTEERLQEIEERERRAPWPFVCELLAEVRRLQARDAVLKELEAGTAVVGRTAPWERRYRLTHGEREILGMQPEILEGGEITEREIE